MTEPRPRGIRERFPVRIPSSPSGGDSSREREKESDVEQPGLPACEPPDPRPRRPRFAVPPGSCDTHAHVFGSPGEYRCSPGSRYIPPDAPLAAYLRMHDALGIERGVLVQSSAHGTDNAALMDALAATGGRLRAVAAVDESISDRELSRLHEAGVRGARVHLADRPDGGFVGFPQAERMARRAREMGWHLEFLVRLSEFSDLGRRLGSLPVEVVIAHMGYVPVGRGLGDPAFQDLLGLVREGRCWVKLSAPYRFTELGRAPYSDLDPFARALVEAGPERMLWGTDWPHPNFWGAMPNDGDLLDQLAAWVPDEETRRRILVDNPAALYGFG